VGYWLKAGQQAVARSAMTEAVTQLQRGLDLLTSTPDDPTCQQQELDLRMTLVQALMATKGWAFPAVGETYARARLLAEQLDRPDCLLALLSGQFTLHLIRSEQKQALSLAQQVEEIGKARNDAVMLLSGRINHGIACLFSGEFDTSRVVLDQCYTYTTDSAERAAIRAASATVLPEDPYVALLATLAVSLGTWGMLRLHDPERGRRCWRPVSLGLSTSSRMRRFTHPG
jgi:predicted ATPase